MNANTTARTASGLNAILLRSNLRHAVTAGGFDTSEIELSQFFKALAVDAALVAIAAGNVAKGVVLTAADRACVLQAAGRLCLAGEVLQ